MASKRFLTIVEIAFVAFLGLVLVSGLVRTLFFPAEVNNYENRKANKVAAFTVKGFLGGEFQNGLDAALSDQVIGSEFAKEKYNTIESGVAHMFLSKLYEANPNKYFKYNNILVYNKDYLLFDPRFLDNTTKEGFKTNIGGYNYYAEMYKDIDFYAYYIEKETDINFETGKKVGFYDYIEKLVNKDHIRLGKYSIDTFDEFAERFFKVDHHWNHVGAYKGYLGICELLGIEDVVEAGEEFLVGEKIHGSKFALAKNYNDWTDVLKAYKFDFPEMKITVNGEEADYGNQNKTGSEFLKENEKLSYSLYFGGDSGEVTFETADKDKGNILIIGDSFDNAVLKLLATHYSKTYSVDLRNYEHYMEKPFDFESYIEENDIDKVLFVGNLDFFLKEEFNVR